MLIASSPEVDDETPAQVPTECTKSRRRSFDQRPLRSPVQRAPSSARARPVASSVSRATTWPFCTVITSATSTSAVGVMHTIVGAASVRTEERSADQQPSQACSPAP